MTGARRTGPWVAVIALALAVIGTLVVLFAPLATVESGTAVVPGEGGGTVQRSRVSILESGDGDVLVAVIIPLALAALPIPFFRSRLARPALVLCAALLTVFAVLTSISIGLAYLPAAAAMWVAAALGGRRYREAAAVP